jgi:PAS domain S-box-containing protein
VFRKDGDSILFLNELRHKQNTALKLRLHINNESLLASKAIRGQLGLVEGVDYRGVPVEGYLSALSHLPWFMVTKIDKEELLSPVNKYYIDSILISLLIFIINTFLFLNWNKSQRIRAIKKKLANETAIRELEEKFSTAFKSSPVSIVILLQSNNHFIDVNDTFTRDMGYTRDEVLGKTPKELNFWFDENERIWILNEIKEKSNIAGKVLSLRTKSGDVMYGLTSVSVITVNGENCNLITVVNITESKKSEQQLLESEDKFKYVFDHSLIGKSITLPTGEVNVNKAFCDMMGYSAEELTKLKWQDFTHPDDIEMTHNIINSILKDKLESVRFSKRYIKKDGSILWADISTTLRLDCKGIPQYFMTSVNDISERMLAEEILRNYSKNLEQSVIQRTEELEVANKELEAFTYSVSHDLRAPLRAVHGFSEILKEDYFKVLDDEGQRICSVISSSATQMSELIDDLLSFSRIGRSTVSATILNMEVIADTIAHELINQEQRKDIKYSIGKLNEVTGDPNLIKNVWYNLISNAIKYSSKQNYPEIFINSRKEGDYIIYSVKDNGVGFEMQYADKLFGVFQRLHSEYEFEGNGVGLAIVKRIINKHGGRIWAESEVGNGATFSFSLPAKEMLNLSESAVTSEQKKVNSEK